MSCGGGCGGCGRELRSKVLNSEPALVIEELEVPLQVLMLITKTVAFATQALDLLEQAFDCGRGLCVPAWREWG